MCMYIYLSFSMQGYLEIITLTLQIDLLQLFFYFFLFFFSAFITCVIMLYMSVLKTMYYVHV